MILKLLKSAPNARSSISYESGTPSSKPKSVTRRTLSAPSVHNVFSTILVQPPPLSMQICTQYSSDGMHDGHDNRPACSFRSPTCCSIARTEWMSGITRRKEAVLVWPFFLGSGTVT